MRLLVPAKMARDLKEEKIGKGEFYAYLFVAIAAAVYVVAFVLGLIDGLVYSPAWLEYADKGLCVLFTIATVVVAYHVNKKGDGKRFWYRFVAISFPIAIVIGALGLALYIAGTALNLLSLDAFGYADLVLGIPLYLWGLYLTVKYMHIIANPAI